MKKIICLIAGSVFALSVFATNPWKDKFCAKMKEGKTVVMHNDKELSTDFTASSGVIIKTDGTVIKKDGSTFMLKEGQCVNTEGSLEKKGMGKSERKEIKEEHKTDY